MIMSLNSAHEAAVFDNVIEEFKFAFGDNSIIIISRTEQNPGEGTIKIIDSENNEKVVLLETDWHSRMPKRCPEGIIKISSKTPTGSMGASWYKDVNEMIENFAGNMKWY